MGILLRQEIHTQKLNMWSSKQLNDKNLELFFFNLYQKMLEENFYAAGTRSQRCNLTITIQQNQKLDRCILRLESTEMVTAFCKAIPRTLDKETCLRPQVY